MAARRLGRRRVFLLLFAGIYSLLGVSTLAVDVPRFDVIAPVIGPVLDSPWWGLLWITAALVAAGVALRPPRSGDGRGFTALLVPPMVWTIFYAASLVSWLVTVGEWGRLSALTGAVAWSIAWVVVLLISGWPDPDPGVAPEPGPARRDG